MAFPTGMESGTTLDVFRPAIWGQRLNDFFRKKLVMANFFVNRSDELSDGGNIVYTPNLTEMAANAKSNATAVTLNQPTETKQTLTVDTWYEVSFAIEDREAAQVKKSYSLQERYAQNAAYTIASKLDTAIATLFSGFTSTVGASTTTVVDSDIRKAIGIAEGSNLDESELAFFFDSKVFWNQVMGLTNFTLSATAAVSGYTPLSGQVGTLYGIPVLRSNNIQYVASTTGRVNALAHKDAIHYATLALGTMSEGGMAGSDGIRIQSNYRAEYLATLVTADIVYGTVLNRATAGVLFYTSAS